MIDQKMPNWLKQRAFLTPDRIAFCTKEETVTYGKLNRQVRSLSLKLSGIGIDKQDKIALLFNNGLDMVRLYHTMPYLGTVAVPLNTRLSAEEQKWQLEDSGAAILIYDEAYRQRAQEIKKLNPKLNMMSMRELESQAEASWTLHAHVNMDDLHTIIYTSGTTGHPKGVMLSYNNHWWSAIGSALNLGIENNDKWLAVVPFFHVSGLSMLMKNVIYGVPVVIHSSFDPEAVNQAIIKDGVTMVSVVTAMLTQMIEKLGDGSYPNTLRCMLLGGGPAPRVILEACKDKGIPVFQSYGLSETGSQIVTLSPEYMFEKLGSAGKPLFPCEIRIMKDHKAAGPNEEGEIVVKGPNVARGYLNRSEATREAIRDGWLYTGDIGYLDEDGFLYVLDRRKDLIISGGENVYPAEVEAVLLQHQEIAESGVIGVSHARWGQVPAAFVKLKDPEYAVTEEEIIEFCKGHLAGYKTPKHIFFVDGLPRNASKKLLRRHLYDLLPDHLKS
ncbi:O-succinylbenzoic acid--CoA ligase [Scopulibacillus daqui]|uniref:2-succinylbenzoate--CoA ligase n=1 Tax=Scopulibacillus daqui TaxID=1469162 RepID=A0ABS2PV27_9BACL|nr:o-succinylbenzoate--CoA ligase [Scopulibacillus daqui]MBM7643908.1 O-succinylbenzoic acid--CoA ligase [Scopulibacillus daqui]